jgi:hypothetical protein
MKMKLVFLMSILFPVLLNAQTDETPLIPVDEEGQIRYVEVVEQSGEAQDLFKRCVKWINGSYKNPTTVTPTRDMVNKKIVIRHQFQLEGTTEEGVATKGGLVMYDMTIRFKDGRYRAEITDFTLKSTSRFPAENWLPEGSNPNPGNLKQLDDFATALMASLKEGMQPEKEYEEEEW